MDGLSGVGCLGMNQRMRTFATMLVLFAGCGRGGLLVGAQSPVPNEPQAVSECKTTCNAPPPAAETPFVLSDSGKPLHWLTCGECVTVSLDHDLPASLARDVPLVLKNWTAASADGLCFWLESTRRVPPAASEPNRIHLRNAGPSLPAGVGQLTSVTFHRATGEIISADVQITENVGSRGLHFGLGQALGLGQGRDPQRSVMISSGGALSSPGPADAVSLTAMYGSPHWCSP